MSYSIHTLTNTNNLESDHFHYTMTSPMFPEQYDVFEKGTDNIVAYIRLRYGHLCVECPDCGGEVVFEIDYDERYLGSFPSEAERLETMNHIDKVLCKHYNIKE